MDGHKEVEFTRTQIDRREVWPNPHSSNREQPPPRHRLSYVERDQSGKLWQKAMIILKWSSLLQWS
jgi:hypothetical protein